MQRTVQHQSLDFVHRPDHRLDRVSTQLLESRDALVTVNDQIAIRLIRMSDNDDRRLLSGSRQRRQDRKSTRLNSSHGYISYAVFCLKKKKETPLHSGRPDVGTHLSATCPAYGVRPWRRRCPCTPISQRDGICEPPPRHTA